MAFDKVKYDNNYQKENYDKILLCVPKGEREKIKKYAISKGYSGTTEYIKTLIKKDMQESGGALIRSSICLQSCRRQKVLEDNAHRKVA